MSFTQYALAVLENGVAHYDDAFAAATDACERQALYLRTFALPELVEAGMRSGQRARAQQALSELEETAVSGTAWARGMLARSRALLSRGRPADRLYIEAIEQLRSCRAAPHLARAHLLYGEWLRRERRRRDARRQLRIAYQMFSSMGIAGFAGRAHDELAATGEHRAQRTVELRDVLTAQEARIARLAADGASNAEIGTQLFISPKTVEYHMHKVFTKLQITTRIQLTQILGGG
jgi:DNA-binding CsgD family transcriptional regulator